MVYIRLNKLNNVLSSHLFLLLQVVQSHRGKQWLNVDFKPVKKDKGQIVNTVTLVVPVLCSACVPVLFYFCRLFLHWEQ